MVVKELIPLLQECKQDAEVIAEVNFLLDERYEKKYIDIEVVEEEVEEEVEDLHNIVILKEY